MQRDTRARLWHARSAAREVQHYLSGKTRADYDGDAVLRSAVERQLITVGEALSHLRSLDPEAAALIPYLPQIVGFRNILIHAYIDIDDNVVWAAATARVDELVIVIDDILPARSDRGGGG